jgi:hypothetical protein
LFESKYLTPVFWLAFFQPADLHIVTTDQSPAAPADSPDEQQMFLVAPLATALATMARRADGLREFVGAPFAPLLDAFVALIRREYEGFVLLDVSDLAAVSTTFFASHGPHVLAALDAVHTFETGARRSAAQRQALDTQCGLSPDWRQSEWASGILCGHAPDWPPAPGETAWEEATAGRAAGDFRDYHPSTRWKLGDLLYHDGYGEGVVTRAGDGNKVEVLFRKESVPLGSGLGAARAADGPTAVDRFLEEPSDQGRWEAGRDELIAEHNPRAEMLSWHEPSIAVDPGGHRWRQFLGPIQRFVDPYATLFRRGFLDRVALKAHRETLRRRPFLHTLGARRDRLLAHPLWRTVREVWGEDDDVLTIALHPNMVSLERLSISARGLSRLSQLPCPKKFRSATGTTFGLEPGPREDWSAALSVGSLTSLIDLTLNLRGLESESPEPFGASSLAWLLEAPLGRQLEHLTLATNGHLRHHLASWIPWLTSHGYPRRLSCKISHGSASVSFEMETSAAGEVTIQIETDMSFPGPDPDGDLPIVNLVREVLSGLPPGTRGTHRHRTANLSEETGILLELFCEAIAPQFPGGLVVRQAGG